MEALDILNDLDEQLTDAGVEQTPEPSRCVCTVPGCSGAHPPCITAHWPDTIYAGRTGVCHNLDLCGQPGGCGLTVQTVGDFPR